MLKKKEYEKIRDRGGVILPNADPENPCIHQIKEVIPNDPITNAGERFKKFIRNF